MDSAHLRKQSLSVRTTSCEILFAGETRTRWHGLERSGYEQRTLRLAPQRRACAVLTAGQLQSLSVIRLRLDAQPNRRLGATRNRAGMAVHHAQNVRFCLVPRRGVPHRRVRGHSSENGPGRHGGLARGFSPVASGGAPQEAARAGRGHVDRATRSQALAGGRTTGSSADGRAQVRAWQLARARAAVHIARPGLHRDRPARRFW